MFELQRLIGASERRIVLQTRLGRDIANAIAPEPTDQHRRLYTNLLRQNGRNWKQRKPPCGGYNCAGHVWASRRTCIYEETDWKKILVEDGYQRTETPSPDDLVLYVERQHGLLHVGRIVELRQGINASSPLIPWVVSKWADWTGEVLHNAKDVPFESQGFNVIVEYWTDRATGKGHQK